MTTRFPLFFLLVAGAIGAFLALDSPGIAAPATAKKSVSPSRAGRIAFTAPRDQSFPTEIYVMNADSKQLTRLTNDQLSSSSQPNFSRDGRKITFVRLMNSKSEIMTMNANGSGQKRLTFHPFDNESPRFSPDGRKIVWARHTIEWGKPEIWIMNADSTGPTFVTRGSSPAYSPDGRKILYVSGREENWQLNLINVDGTGRKPLPTGDKLGRFHPIFSPDGKKIAVEFSSLGNFLWDDTDVCILNADGTGQINLTATDPKELPRLEERQEAQDGPSRPTFAPFQGSPTFSPDGRSIAFSGSEKDRDSETLIWVMNLDGTGKTRLAAGAQPSWAPGFVPKPKTPKLNSRRPKR